MNIITKDTLIGIPSHWWTAFAFAICFFLFCPNLYSQEVSSPVSEKKWSEIFLEITETNPYQAGRASEYIQAAIDYATVRTNASTKKIKGGEVASGLEEGLIGHLLAWYVSELSPDRGKETWINHRNALLANRRVYVKFGLDSTILETSFKNMNNAAQTLGLPSAKDLN